MTKFKIFLLYFLVWIGTIFAQIPNDSLIQNRKFENFKDDYSGKDFNYLEKKVVVNKSAWDNFWNAIGDFFRNLFNFGDSQTNFSFLEILMKIIAILIIVFVIYMIVKIIINKEGGWIFSTSKKQIKIEEIELENIHNLNFAELILKAKKEKNYRLSIRYYYLWVLKSLTDSEKIQWDIEKTNSDYCNEINDAQLKKEFQFLSYIYDYSWYGAFELNENHFNKAEADFLKLISKK
jgi:hypothetical protein